MNSLIVTGSVADVSQKNNSSLADALLDVVACALVDVSGSMVELSNEKNKTRYEAANEALARLQAKFPGKLAVTAFWDKTVFCPGGSLPKPDGGTNLADGLRFVKMSADVGIKVIVISDGEPNSKSEALDVAKTYMIGMIDTIYVGPEGEPGAKFLSQLAKSCGGKASNLLKDYTPKSLEQAVILSLPASLK